MNVNLIDQLVDTLIHHVSKIKSVVITDNDGLAIYSKQQSGEESKDLEVGATTAVFDSFLSRIKQEFTSENSFNFLNIIKVEEQKFLFCNVGESWVLTAMTEPDINETKLKTLSRYTASQIALVLQGFESDVKLDYPPITLALSNMKTGKLPQGEYSMKLILMGDPMVGKTSLIRRLVDDQFKNNYISSIGVNISKKSLDYAEDSEDRNTCIKFSIWDIGGQSQQMLPFRQRFYTGAQHVFIVFDLSRKKTLDNMKSWIDDLHKNLKDKRISATIIANKDDMEEKDVTIDDIKKISEELDAPYILTSAKTGKNVIDAFRYAGYKYFESM